MHDQGKTMANRVYPFSWELIGDVKKGRPHIGEDTRLEIYRLFQFTIRDVLEQELGSKEKVDHIFFEAGKLAGKSFVEKFVGKQETLYIFLSLLQKKLQEFKIGILRVEQVSQDDINLIISIEEDLDCSGLPDTGMETCHYDEGFIKGALDFQTGNRYSVKEIDCWCLGGRTCRFEAQKTDK